MTPPGRERSRSLGRSPLAVVVSAQPARFQAATFKGDLQANLARVAAMGYDGAELAIRDPALVDAEALSDLLEAAGLSAPAIGTGQAWAEEGLSFADPDEDVRRAAMARVGAQIQLGARLGSLIIIGLIRGTVSSGVEPAQAHAWMVEALRESARAADSRGVSLAVEPINRYETGLVNTVEEGRALLDEVGAANVGLLLDTFHMNIEEPSIEASIAAAGRRIFHFHVADSNRRHPGAGHLDFASILATLLDTGYRGFVSGEFLPYPDAATAAERAIQHLRGVG
ncbi:MAG: sugar phosphate isomerase/epimerase [Anaerolineae bacterium]|nr:sugar phosphate isomerase/epimerase [Anaerolineae bacterium]